MWAATALRGAYWFYDAQNDTVEHIADLAPWIHEEDMCSMHPVSYTSRDGLHIEAYLSLPDGLTPETAHHLPVIINPHGGPWSRDTWGFFRRKCSSFVTGAMRCSK